MWRKRLLHAQNFENSRERSIRVMGHISGQASLEFRSATQAGFEILQT